MATNRPTRLPTLQHWRRRTKSKSSPLPPNTSKHLFEFISTTNGLLGNNNEKPILTDGKSFLKASHDSRVNAHCRTNPNEIDRLLKKMGSRLCTLRPNPQPL